MATATTREYNPKTGRLIGTIGGISFDSVPAGRVTPTKVVDLVVDGYMIDNVRLRITSSVNVSVNDSPEDIAADGSAGNGNFGIEHESEFIPRNTLTRFFPGQNDAVTIGTRSNTESQFVHLNVKMASQTIGPGAATYQWQFDVIESSSSSSSSSSLSSSQSMSSSSSPSSSSSDSTSSSSSGSNSSSTSSTDCGGSPSVVLTVTGVSGTVNWCGETWNLPADSGVERAICPLSYNKAKYANAAYHYWQYNASLSMYRAHLRPTYYGSPYVLVENRALAINAGLQRVDGIRFANYYSYPNTGGPNPPWYTTLFYSDINNIVNPTTFGPGTFSDYNLTDQYFGSYVSGSTTYSWAKGMGW